MQRDIDLAVALRSRLDQTITVGAILRLIGVKIRTHIVREQVSSALAEAGLTTEPDWELAALDEPVVVRQLAKDAGDEAEPPQPDADTFPEIAPTIRMLLDGREPPKTIPPEAPLSSAIHRMLTSQLDHLPVVDENGALAGALTWKSYAAMHVAANPRTLANAIDPHPPTVQHGTDLLDAVSMIATHGYVLVRDQYGKLCGLVTMADLAVRYRDLLAPFQKIGEIERRMRRCTNARLDAADFDAAWRGKTRAEELTFGQYRKLLDEPGRWTKFKLDIDRERFCDLLHSAKEVRNKIAHFDTDHLDEARLDDVDRLLGLLRSLDPH